jgi:type I restriction enzyme S subunit
MTTQYNSLNSNPKGIGIPHIDPVRFWNIHVPVAPLREQRRVGSEVEKQFTRLDAGAATLNRVQANLERYRGSVLKAACEGLLVPTEAELALSENRPYKPASELLNRILQERRAKGKLKEPFVDIANLPELPNGWCWTKLGLLGAGRSRAVQTGPFGAQLHKRDFRDSGVPVIAVGNLTGIGFTTNGLYHITETKARQLSRYDVWAGDVLFARSGATLGKVCVAPAEVQDWRMTGHILRARLNKEIVVPQFVVFALAGLPSVRNQVFGKVRGVTRPGFNTTLLESICIPVPPLAEQRRILIEVDRLQSVIDATQNTVNLSIKRAARLRESILQFAFRGELVARDPDDGPAEELLKGIRTHKMPPQVGQGLIAVGDEVHQ